MSHRAPALCGLQCPIISLALISYHSVLCRLWLGHTGQLHALPSPGNSSNIAVMPLLGAFAQDYFLQHKFSFPSCPHVSPPRLFPTFAQMSPNLNEGLPKLPHTQPSPLNSLSLALLFFLTAYHHLPQGKKLLRWQFLPFIH